jgi:hypothetical protein
MGYTEAPHASELNVIGDWTIESWFKDQDQNGYDHFSTVMLTKDGLWADKDVPFALGLGANALFVAEKANGQAYFTSYDLEGHNVSVNSSIVSLPRSPVRRARSPCT